MIKKTEFQELYRDMPSMPQLIWKIMEYPNAIPKNAAISAIYLSAFVFKAKMKMKILKNNNIVKYGKNPKLRSIKYAIKFSITV